MNFVYFVIELVLLLVMFFIWVVLGTLFAIREMVIAVTRFIVRILCQMRYGVRGALEPPITPSPFYEEVPWPCLAWYIWRRFVWIIDSKLYRFSGLPERWDKRRVSQKGEGQR